MTTSPLLATKSPTPPGFRWAWLVLVVVFGLHIFLASRLFPSLGSIVDPDSPVVVVDHAIHEYHGSLGARFFRDRGTSWGYDPFFMAGYPETPVWDSSSNPSILLNLLGGQNAGYRGYKVGLFVASILVLGAIAAGARSAGLGSWEVTMAAVFAFVVFWSGFPIALWRSGLFAFVSASAGTGLLLGLCSKFDRRPSRSTWVALTCAGLGLFFVHITTPILAIGGLFPFWASTLRRQGRRWHLAIVGAAVLAVVGNLPWLVPLWRFRSIRTSSGLFMTTNNARFVLDYFLAPSVEGRVGLTLLVLGAFGLGSWWFRGLKGSAMAFGGASVGLIVLTGFGSFWEPTKTLEPLRFRVAFLFLLAVPAGSAVARGSGKLARRAGGGRRGTLAVSAVWVAVFGGWGVAEWPFFRACWSVITQHRPLVVGIKPEMRLMVEWLRKNTDLSGRILFEDQLRLLENTDPESVHWTPLLPELLGTDSRMFIGGLYQTAFIKHHQMAAFGDFQLGDRPIDEWSPLQVKNYCETYNVGWVVCWSPLSRFYFDRHEPAKRVATLPRYATPNRPPSPNEHEWRAISARAGSEVARRYMMEGEENYAIYRVDRPRTYFLQGKGRVVAVAPDRVELADVEPDRGAVVLSLHWLETWKTDPPFPIGPEPMPTDPVDFVRIALDRPTPRVVLTNGRR